MVFYLNQIFLKKNEIKFFLQMLSYNKKNAHGRIYQIEYLLLSLKDDQILLLEFHLALNYF